MKPFHVALIGLTLACLLSSCRQDSVNLLGMDHETWARTTYIQLDYPIPGHMDKLREIYINPTANQVVIARDGGKRSFRYPVGTVVVKEIFASSNPAAGDKPVALTGMVKSPADPRARGGWLWVMRDLKSGAEQVFTNEFCFTCHANANERHPYGDKNTLGEFRDYLFFPWDPQQAPVQPAASPSASPGNAAANASTAYRY